MNRKPASAHDLVVGRALTLKRFGHEEINRVGFGSGPAIGERCVRPKSVTVSDPSQQISVTTKTNDQGVFVVAGLRPRTYHLRFEAMSWTGPGPR